MLTISLRMRRWVVLLIGLGLSASAPGQDSSAFRVCADPNNLPLSSKNEDGFENRIAELWAKELGLPLEYTWFPQRRGFIRNTLKALNESGSEYKCDVVMGVASGYDRLMTTKPYYRSTYALVYAKARNLEQMVAFSAMSGDPGAYPGEIIEKELAGGRLDAAVIWGPMAGFFAKRASGVEMVVIPLESEPGIQFDFAISAGVRYGDSDRKRVLEELIRKTAVPMEAIFAAYNVPLLDIVPDTDLAGLPDDD